MQLVQIHFQSKALYSIPVCTVATVTSIDEDTTSDSSEDTVVGAQAPHFSQLSDPVNDDSSRGGMTTSATGANALPVASGRFNSSSTHGDMTTSATGANALPVANTRFYSSSSRGGMTTGATGSNFNPNAYGAPSNRVGSLGVGGYRARGGGDSRRGAGGRFQGDTTQGQASRMFPHLPEAEAYERYIVRRREERRRQADAVEAGNALPAFTAAERRMRRRVQQRQAEASIEDDDDSDD